MTRNVPAPPKPSAQQRAAADATVNAAGLDLPDALPAPSNPMGVATELLLERTVDGQATLLRQRGTWRQRTDAHWPEVDQAEIVSWLYRRTEHAQYAHVDPRTGAVELRPWRPNKTKISHVLEALAAKVLLSGSVDAPAWLDEVSGRPPASQLIPVRNGLLEIGPRTLHPHSVRFFNEWALPFDYDPDAPEPGGWLAFLDQLWPGQPDAVELLQEWFGVVLSGRTEQQKILLFNGPPRSGKGTIARVLQALVGRDNYASPTLGSLATNFGLAPLIGKSLAVISDARLSTKADVATVVERLLSVSGEDALTVDRKYRDPWTGQLSARFMILSNELPRLGDASGAIANRFVILTLTQSFLGREDVRLTKRLLGELPGILRWSLDGLDRLTERGAFVEPESSRDAVAALAELVSPISGFLRDRCGEGGEVPVEDIYRAWTWWANSNGHAPGSSATFGRNLHAVRPDLKKSRPNEGGNRVWKYVGIHLLPAAAPQAVHGSTTVADFMQGAAAASGNGVVPFTVPLPSSPRGGAS